MTKGNKDGRSPVKMQNLESIHCYLQRNRHNTNGRLELRKYDSVVRHVVSREGKR